MRDLPLREHEHRFLTVAGTLIAVFVLAGFARTYFLRPAFHLPDLPLRLHLHGLLFSSWIALFIVQVRLIAGRRVRWHRWLGVFGALLAALMVVVVSYVAITAARRDYLATGKVAPLSFLAIAFGDVTVFVLFAGVALLLRRNAETHKRLMLLATIALLPPAIARLPVIGAYFFVITDIFAVAMLTYDFWLWRRLNRALLWGVVILVASQPARLALGRTDLWLRFAKWMIG